MIKDIISEMNRPKLEACHEHGPLTVVSYLGTDCPLCKIDGKIEKLESENDDLRNKLTSIVNILGQ